MQIGLWSTARLEAEIELRLRRIRRIDTWSHVRSEKETERKERGELRADEVVGLEKKSAASGAGGTRDG